MGLYDRCGRFFSTKGLGYCHCLNDEATALLGSGHMSVSRLSLYPVRYTGLCSGGRDSVSGILQPCAVPTLYMVHHTVRDGVISYVSEHISLRSVLTRGVWSV